MSSQVGAFVAVAAIVMINSCAMVSGFVPSRVPQLPTPHAQELNQVLPHAALKLSNNSNEEFSRDVRLREEAESPFRKVRYFLYLNGLGGALSSLFISGTRVIAALNGINTDLMQESLINCGVDIGGIIVVGLLYKRDVDAEQSRLKRATKGAKLAKLTVRASKSMLEMEMEGTAQPQGTFTTSLGSFRRNRGLEKRVVLAAAGEDKIADVIEEAKSLEQDLELNDLVVIPVVMPQGKAPAVQESDLPRCVAVPVVVADNWRNVINDEASEAIKQGVDIEKEGFCVIVKKNGRVGQRTKGIFLNNLVGNVVARREAGMDVTNI